MEANENGTNHLDFNVLLPPRKRLLAGLKRQSSESPSKRSQETTGSTLLSEYDARLHTLLKSCKNGSYMTPEEIAKAAESAAIASAKVAEAARAAADEKAAIAAKAVRAAKSALNLVTSFPMEIASRDGYLNMNKLKRHLPVQLFHKERQAAENCGADEEIARNLHRAINSSPRISKHSPERKKVKSPLHLENNGVPNGMLAGVLQGMGSEGSYEKLSKTSEADQFVEINGAAESSHSNFNSSVGRKRGRIKLKKVPLRLCSFKDRSNPHDDSNESSSEFTRTMLESSAPSKKLIYIGEPRANALASLEPALTWKCQDIKAPMSIKSHKAVQS